MKKTIFFISTFMLLSLIVIFIYFSKNANINFHTVYINEVMSSNKNSITDYDGEYSDWIELYNPNDIEVNLAGYYLTDDVLDLTKWEFPRNFFISAKSHYLLFASGKNKIYPPNEYHLNFRLSSYGETLLLVAPDKNTIIDEIDVQRIGDDASYGRVKDGDATWKIFNDVRITPNSSNLDALNLPLSPHFSHCGGVYEAGFTLKLSSSIDTTIYYTTDGSIPTKNSQVYQEGILIDKQIYRSDNLSSKYSELIDWYQPKDDVFKGIVIKAIAYQGNKQSEIVTHTFFVDDKLDYDIPIVSLSTNEANLLDEEMGIFYYDGEKRNYYERGEAWEREGYIEYFAENNSGFADKVGIRVHGGASRSAPNKALRIYARGESGYFNYQLFPDKEVDKFSNFILRNGGSDWQHVPFRDAFLQSLLKDYTNVDIQYYQPVMLFLNGEYWGLYMIRDRFDDDYLYNHYEAEDIDMISDKYTLVYGSDRDYLKLREFLNSKDLNFGDNYEYVKTKLDVNNFADYSIAQIYYMNVDQPGKNVKIWRTKTEYDSKYQETDGRWRYLLYDTDMSFFYNEKGKIYAPYDRNGLVYNTGLDYHGAKKVNDRDTLPTFAPNYQDSTFMLRKMLGSDEFRLYFINRFADLLNTAFLETVVSEKLENIEQSIYPYLQDHIDRWHLPNEPELRENIDLMKVFANNRPFYMRKHIVDYFALSGTYLLTINLNENGSIALNSLDITNDLWTGSYFQDIPIEINAYPKSGYRFKHWVSNNKAIDGLETPYLKIALDKDTSITPVYEEGNPIIDNSDEIATLNPNYYPLFISFSVLVIVISGTTIFYRWKK